MNETSASGNAGSGAIVEYRPPSIVEYGAPRVVETPPAFERWTTFASQAGVRAMATAPVSRTVWIATWGGVLAWDRSEHECRRYGSEHGLAGTPSCIAIASDDWPWVGHVEGGLSIFDAGRWHPYEHLRNERVLAIAASTAGKVWVATPQRLALVERDRWPVDIVRGESEVDGARALLEDDARVLIASASGLFRASSNGAIERIGADDVRECTALARNAEGRVVVGTINGIINGDGVRITPDRGDATVAAIVPSRKGVWVLTRSGVARIENGRWRSMPALPRGASNPRAIVADETPDERLWIGTDNLLIGARANGESPDDAGILPNHPGDELSNLGRCSVSLGESAYVGTASGLLIGRQDGTWERDAELGDVRAAIITGRVGREELWVLSWPGGVFRWARDERSWQPVAIGDSVAPRMLVQSREGDPHVLDGPRLVELHDGNRRYVSRNVPQDARAVVQAPGGTWFAATDRGLLRLRDYEWTIERELGSVSVSAFDIALFQLWVGVPGAVWTLVGDVWTRIALEQDRVVWTEPVTAIAHTRRHDALWIACGDRVALLNIETSRVVEVHNRFTSGVCGDQIVSLAVAERFLWVVSKSGVARYRFDHDD